MTDERKSTSSLADAPHTGETVQADMFATRDLAGVRVEVVEGPDKGLVHALTEPSLVVGKGALSGLRLSDETVSREHVRFELTATGVVVQDAGSKNGTWMGAARLRSVTLHGDASIKLGATTLAISLTAKPLAVVVSASEHFGAAYAQSIAMRHLFARLTQVARSEISVLLEGESGVGKELLARGVHEASPRRDGPFVAVDCGSIPAELVESELFGHERGAFTGADRAKPGLFEQASGGTVFLDELGELPIEVQPKLLRALQEREIRRVGSNKTIPVDIRVVAATNRSLKDRCAEGKFRDDLYYRVAELRVRVPSLRERPDDIAPLARTFLRKLTGDAKAELPVDILAMLTSYPWPGNVRELRNVVSRFALVDARERQELFDDASAVRRADMAQASDDLTHLSFSDARKLVLERLEAAYFPAMLERSGGVISRAAEASGISRSTFYRMLERHTAMREGGEPE